MDIQMELMTSILAYEWYLECRRNYDSKYVDWQISLRTNGTTIRSTLTGKPRGLRNGGLALR